MKKLLQFFLLLYASVCTLAVTGMIILVLLAAIVRLPDPPPAQEFPKEVTGYELFEAVNEYRSSLGIPPISLHPAPCNNIGERANVYEEKNSHAGLQEHAERHIYSFPPTREHPRITVVAELLGSGTTGKEIVSRLSTSPSHDLFLKDPSFRYGCAYARYAKPVEWKGGLSIGVIILAK